MRFELVAAFVALVVVGGCSNNPPPVMLPEGIHITGAVDAVYPISNGGTCLPIPDPLDGRVQLSFSANARAGQALVGWVVENYGEPGTYTTSSEYVRAGGRQWKGSSSQINVTYADVQMMKGTVSWTGLSGENDATKVSASGSWTCRVLNLPSPTPSPVPSPLVFPSPSPLPAGTPVMRQVLAPAKVLPIAALCSYKLTATADGNFWPTLCRGGAINVLAWRKYVSISPNLLSAGRTATFEAVRAATCRDDTAYHATFVEEEYAYEMASAYYGWKFATEPNCR